MLDAPPVFDAAFRDDLCQLLRWRRDVRSFSSKPLPEALVTDLLEQAQYAPSVGNSQPWRIIRVRSPELREQLAEHVDEQATRAGARYDPKQQQLYASLKLHGLREAPEILAVFCEEDSNAGSGLGAQSMPETRAYSVAIMVHTLWLLARAQGIGMGWVSILNPEYVSALLDVPARHRLIAVLCLGYPTETSAIPELERKGWQAHIDWRTHVIER